jgi:hypothetical protein
VKVGQGPLERAELICGEWSAERCAPRAHLGTLCATHACVVCVSSMARRFVEPLCTASCFSCCRVVSSARCHTETCAVAM